MTRMRPERRHRLAGCSAMKPSAQYREFAEDCMLLAKRARTEEERKILLEMAATWRTLADEADQQNAKTRRDTERN
jgi:hypothetical protein